MAWIKKHGNEILIFSLFILLSIVATYPLVLRMKSHVYGLGGDALGTISQLWRIKYTYLNPSAHPLIAYPYGVNVSHLAAHILKFTLLNPLTLLSNEIFAHNFFILISFSLSAIIVYYLVYHFTGDKLASMISGIIYTICPYRFAHLSHLTLVNIQWIPLFFLTLFNLDEKRTYGSAVLAALVFSLVLLSDYYYGYFITIFTGIFILWRVWYGWKNRRLSGYPVIRLAGEKKDQSPLKTARVVLVAAAVTLAIILPLMHRTLKIAISPKTESIASLGYKRSFNSLFTYAAQFFHYLLPSGNNPFIGGLTRNFIKVCHPTEQTLYLGWVGIILSFVAIRQWRRKNREQRIEKRGYQVIRSSGHQVIKRNRQADRSLITDHRSQKAVSFFLFAGIMALVFSHAPWTDIGPLRIFFPSYFLYKIAPMFRVYARFGIVAMLCVSVLAGVGLTSILRMIKGAQKRRVFLFIILLLIFIEFAPTLPAPMVNAFHPPPVYVWLSKQEGDFIIAEYPVETDYEYLFWQRIHHKRLVNGAVPGTQADKIRKELVDILRLETPGILKYLGAKYIIFHPDKYLKSKDVPVIGEVPDLSKQKNLKLIKTFDKAQVYEITAMSIRP